MIRVQNVSKTFKVYGSPADRLKEKIFRKQYHHEYAALSGISFEVGPGETLGIIGENGAGKSTLLKILSGVLLPDTGTVEVSGKVTGLLELGTGFNPELTGVQNIFMNGTFLGMSHDEIEGKKEIIIDFAELGEFINEPIKTYSSGMMMRLGFSIAIHADPECFLVDEALSVGDAYFQQKCMRKIQEFKEQGGSIIFVSHDMNAVKVLCDRAFLLNSGKIMDYGNPKDVVDYYYDIILSKCHVGENKPIISRKMGANQHIIERHIISTDQVEIISVFFQNENNQIVNSITSGDNLNIVVTIKFHANLIVPHYGIIIRNHLGSDIYGISTESLNIQTRSQSIGDIVTIKMSLPCTLSPGDYSVTVGVANGVKDYGLFDEYCLFITDTSIFKILTSKDNYRFTGLVDLHGSLEIIEEQSKLTYSISE